MLGGSLELQETLDDSEAGIGWVWKNRCGEFEEPLVGANPRRIETRKLKWHCHF